MGTATKDIGLSLKVVEGVSLQHHNFYSKNFEIDIGGPTSCARGIKRMLVDIHYATVRTPTAGYWRGRAHGISEQIKIDIQGMVPDCKIGE